MRKSFAWLICMVFVYVLICASSDNYMKWLTKQRSNQPEILTSDKYTFGDLYGFSFLPQFRFKTVLPNYLPLEKIHHQNGKLDFYILGDSYLYSFFDKKTAHLSTVIIIHIFLYSYYNLLLNTLKLFRSTLYQLLLLILFLVPAYVLSLQHTPFYITFSETYVLTLLSLPS